MGSDRMDALRIGYGAAESNLIDAMAAGRVDRRTFIRQGSILGFTLPLIGATFGSRPALAIAGLPGGSLRVGQLRPRTEIEPLKVSDAAGVIQLSTTGEYLCLNGADMILVPMLAERWSANQDASVWTFKIRKGVKFHNGKPMTASDVVSTFDRLTDPDNGSNALTLLAGYLSKGGTRKVDEDIVEFHLESAHGSFPYLVSSDNYNAIILPADYRGDFETSFAATGPFKLEKFSPGVGSSFVRNGDYWGRPALADRIEFTFLNDPAAQIQALQAGQIDVMHPLPARLGATLGPDPRFEIIAVPSSAHHQVHMRCDLEPFRDPLVRKAVALCLDRPALAQNLTGGLAEIGNDSPFAAVFPSTDRSVPQRRRNMEEARRMMVAAGMADGFSVTLTTEKFLEIPDYARAIQEAVKVIGGRIDLEVLDQGAYYADGVFGKSPWLESPMGITDYDHRGLPNVCLSASLRSDGAWNAAHYRNPAYDALVASYIGAADIEAQRQIAGQIEKTLLADTPVIFAYFHKAMTAVRKGTTGVRTTAAGHLFLSEASPAR